MPLQSEQDLFHARHAAAWQDAAPITDQRDQRAEKMTRVELSRCFRVARLVIGLRIGWTVARSQARRARPLEVSRSGCGGSIELFLQGQAP